MIHRDIKRVLGQMVEGVQVVGAAHGGVRRAYTSTWVGQVAFGEPILLASVSPKHETHPLIVASGRFAVSILAGDQVEAGQYFSYPGHKMHHIADELLVDAHGLPVVGDSIGWLCCEVVECRSGIVDHDLILGRVFAVGEGRVGEPPLLYSSRRGWRVVGGRARDVGDSVRDRLLARVEADGDADGDDSG